MERLPTIMFFSTFGSQIRKQDFFIMNKKLCKSNDKMIAGVCAGIAEFLGWDITVVRAAYAFLSVFTAGFPGLLLYIILCIVMPPAYSKQE